MEKPAPAEHDLHPLIRQRFSPRAFSGRPVPDEILRSLLEAARWAPSCLNEQPWRFIVAHHSDTQAFDDLLSCLNEHNQVWAKEAPLLLLAVAARQFVQTGKPNRHALHDVGLAVAQLILQATDLGLGVHQMAGFSMDRAVEVYDIPEDFEPVSAIAVGYPGDPDQLPVDLRERELAPRTRKPQSEFVFQTTFGQPLS